VAEAEMWTGRLHLVNFIRKFTVTAAFFLGPLYFLKLGFSGLQIGAVVSCFAFAPILVSFPAGWTNDRLSIKKMAAAGLSAEALSLVLIGLVRSPAAMALVFLLAGAANNVLDVSTNSLYYKAESAADPNRRFGTYAFWLSLGAASGLLAGGALSYFSGYRVLVMVFAGVTALAAVPVRGFGGETFTFVGVREYGANLLRKKALAFAVLLFFLSLHWGVEGTVYAPFLRKRFGLDDFHLALYMSLSYFALVAASWMVSRLPFDAARNRILFLAGMGLSGLGLMLMVQADVRVSFLFRVVHEAGDGLMGALTVLYISGLFEKRSIGGSAGLLTALQTSGQMAGALVFSAIGFRAGLQYPFILAGLVLLADAAFGLYAVPERGRPERAAEPA